jgi:putative SOS response-associated peptidase YedK
MSAAQLIYNAGMCGRYTLYEIDRLSDRFKLRPEEVNNITQSVKKRYNIAPSQLVPTVVERDSGRRLEIMQWGFMPVWAKDTSSVFKYRTFNARSEDIFAKPLWKNAIRHSRCLVPANGFYEWKATPTGKQPYFIRPQNEQLFAFAGVYSTWKNADGLPVGTYSIVTTSANKDMEPIHNRMPVILHPGQEDAWLDPGLDEPGVLEDIMHPYEDGELELYEVSRDVNTSRVDTETLVAPLNSQ